MAPLEKSFTGLPGLPPDLRRRGVAALTIEGVAVATLAKVFAVSEATIYRDRSTAMGTTQGKRASRRQMLEAGVAYLARFGELPTSRAWNPTLAQDAGLPLAERWKQGWIDPAAPEEIAAWPNASDVASAFGSFTSFCDAVRIEYAARLSEDALRVIDVPKERQALAQLTALLPAAPDEVERVDVDAQALSPDGLAMLLAARGEIELADMADFSDRLHGCQRPEES